MSTGVTDPQEIARSILSERRFSPAPLPRPFAGFFEALGRALRPIVTRWDRAFAWLATHLPGGTAALWTVISVSVVAIACVVATRLVARRTRSTTERQIQGRVGRRTDPGQLEAEADEAERRGNLKVAVRLRFLAGLMRLDRAAVISLERSTTARAVAQTLGSSSFDHLAATFERIIYGDQPATPTDVSESRTRWTSLLREHSVR